MDRLLFSLYISTLPLWIQRATGRLHFVGCSLAHYHLEEPHHHDHLSCGFQAFVEGRYPVLLVLAGRVLPNLV